MRRVGVLVSLLAADDPEWQARHNAFVQGLQERGWSDGRNVRLEYRWGLGDPDRLRKYAAELVALAPDVMFAAGALAVATLHQSSRSVPIVFANVQDPVGLGLVASLARPGGNVTGFASTDFGLSAKLLELLKQVAPRVARVAVVRNAGNPVEIVQFGAIQAVAPSLGMELVSLAIKTPEGLAVVVGCSHPGVEKVLENATSIDPQLYTVTGGFHLVVTPAQEVQQVASTLYDKLKIKRVAPGHCTSEMGFKVLMEQFKDRFDQAGLGQTIILP